MVDNVKNLTINDVNKSFRNQGNNPVQVLKVGKDYAILNRGGKYEPFVVAWKPYIYTDNDGIKKITWGQGHYFSDIVVAVKYFNDMEEEEEED